MSTTTPDPSTPDLPADEFDDGLMERLGELGTYVSASPSPVSDTAFSESSARSTTWSLSARLAEAGSQRERLDDAG